VTVSTTYSFAFQASIDPSFISADADAVGTGSSVYVAGDDGPHIDATVFDDTGAIIGNTTVIPGTDAAVGALSDGNFVIMSDTGTQSSFQIVNSTGGVVVASTAIGTVRTDVLNVDVAGLAGGGFVAVIQEFFGGTDNDIRIFVRTNAGANVTSFAIDLSGADDQKPSVAALADGGFAVAWHRNVAGESELWYAVYEANGTVRKAAAQYDTAGTINRNASVVALQDGGFAIAYEDNGWGGDVDITFSRFTSAGVEQVQTNVSLNGTDDTLPSTTVLSSGQVAMGTTTASGDVLWTMIDPTTGLILGTSGVGSTMSADTATTVAMMADGKLATFFTAGADIVGQILQGTRTSIGDSASDSIVGDDLRDIVIAGGGDDVITGGRGPDTLNGEAGNDTFNIGAGEVNGDAIDGGTGQDVLLLSGSTNLTKATVQSIEEVEFAAYTFTAGLVTVGAEQIGAGLSSSLLIDGDYLGVPDTFKVVLSTTTSVDLSGFQFQDFDTTPGGPENDRLSITGDDDAEIIVGSSVGDVVSAFGGDDRLTGGGGVDTLRGGAGNDLYIVDTTGEAIEAAGAGTDSVKSSVTYTLGANLEKLTLTGVLDIDGTGNTLANTIVGNNGVNTLKGGTGNDIISGLGGADVINGGAGADVMTGGGGFDTFDFNLATDGVPGLATRDVIKDFTGNGNLAGDLIDLSTIDANTGVAGNQVFTFIGAAAFSAAGQVRYVNGSLLANTNADLAADFEVKLAGSPALVAADLIL
jgi:hypothetical protein